MSALTKWKDVISALMLMLVSAAMFHASGSLEARTRMEIGPDFMPKVVSVLTFALAAVLLMQGLRRARSLSEAQDAEAPTARRGDFIERHADRLCLALIVAYAFAFEPLGYLVSTTIFLFLEFIIMAPADSRRYLPFALAAVVVSVATYYVFVRLFYVFLPIGFVG